MSNFRDLKSFDKNSRTPYICVVVFETRRVREMAMIDFFKTAEVLPAPQKKSNKDDREVIGIDGLEEVAVIDALIKTFETLKATLREPVNVQMRGEFIANGGENFAAIDDNSSASAELRKRSTASALKAEEVALLEAANIPVGEEVTQEERFVINPAYMNDQEFLGKISAALSKVKGMPLDFIQKQPKVAKKVVTQETFDTVMGDETLAPQFIDVVGVLALKPKLERTDLVYMIGKASELLGLADVKPAEKKAPAKKKGK